jgi:hypothetical protein
MIIILREANVFLDKVAAVNQFHPRPCSQLSETIQYLPPMGTFDWPLWFKIATIIFIISIAYVLWKVEAKK